MNRNVRLIICFLCLVFTGIAQVKVGQWKDHLSYNSCNTVAKAGDAVYASNGTGIIKYTISDGSTELISKINGLSDIGITLLRYNPYNGALLIVYNNANIDILKNGEFTNFSDIKNKSITGKKNINEVVFKNNIAYLSCGFGIVVFDTDRLEIKDTYLIGPGGSYINVYQLEYTDTTFIAATTGGLYRANTSTLLNDFQNWSLVSGVPAGTYNGVVKYGNKLVANYSPYAANNTVLGKDTLYNYNGITGWQKDTIKPFPYSLKKLIRNGSYFTDIEAFGAFESYNPAGSRSAYYTGYSFGYANINDVSVDFSKPEYWIADLSQGFIRSDGPFSFNHTSKISVNGTHSNFVNSIDIFDGKVLSSPTKIDETGTPHYSKEGLNLYQDNEWSYVKESVVDTVFDYTFAMIDRNDPARFWAGSWFQGLCEYYNGQLIKIHNSINSAIPAMPAYAYWHRVAGLSTDQSGNLWVGSSEVQNFLTVRKTNGTFQNFNFGSVTPYVGRILADKHDQIWVTFPRSAGAIGTLGSVTYSTAIGLAVFKNNNFAPVNHPVNFKFLTLQEGQGKLPDPYVYAIAEDLNGQIWIGTSQGIAVFYNPENIFTGANYDAQQILITQDTHVQILLGTEKVTAITVDGANRKWVGTVAAGIFCFSPDGQQEIYHFTADNSPLFSNVVQDLAYNETTGDIFIGTDQGMQSYRTDIIKGEKEYKEVHAYPNPVKPGYTGNVYVKGLIDQSVVKITDINGNLVWETKSQGGQIAWGLKNIKGQKVAPGIYFASCALTDGSISAMAKILVMN